MHPPDSGRIDRLLDIARGVAPAGSWDREHRDATRLPFLRPVALILFKPSGETTRPMIMTADNISSGGLCVIGSRELSVGCRGAVMVAKSGGEPIILGTRVVYANARGLNEFECGLEFEFPPAVISFEDFRDTHGNLPELGRARAA